MSFNKLTLCAAVALLIRCGLQAGAINVLNYDTGSDANVGVTTGTGPYTGSFTADFTTTASVNSYFLVTASTRNGGVLLSDLSLSLGGGPAVNLDQHAFVLRNTNDNSLLSIWGISVSNVTSGQSVLVNATSDDDQNYNVAVLQLGAANPIALADFDGTDYQEDRDLLLDIGSGDFVFSAAARRSNTQTIVDPTTVNIGAFDSNLQFFTNTLLPDTGSLNVRRNYWLDPTAGTDVAFGYRSIHDGSAGVVLTVVPEPSSIALVGLAFLTAVVIRHRKR